jgi:hypothetical protein
LGKQENCQVAVSLSIANALAGIVKLTNPTLNSPPEEVCQRRRASGKFFTQDCIT